MQLSHVPHFHRGFSWCDHVGTRGSFSNGEYLYTWAQTTAAFHRPYLILPCPSVPAIFKARRKSPGSGIGGSTRPMNFTLRHANSTCTSTTRQTRYVHHQSFQTPRSNRRVYTSLERQLRQSETPPRPVTTPPHATLRDSSDAKR